MSALNQVDEVPRDSHPTTPPAAFSDNAAVQDPTGLNPVNSPQGSPALSPRTPGFRANRGRRGSTASHVSVDYFDPDGVKELRRTLTRMTTDGPEIIEENLPPPPPEREPSPQTSSVRSNESEASESTLAARDGTFDFAKTLRDIVKKCAFLANIIKASC
jgi:ATP-binding cassette, subfamily G (WHITE), member 2, SNQ2